VSESDNKAGPVAKRCQSAEEEGNTPHQEVKK